MAGWIQVGGPSFFLMTRRRTRISSVSSETGFMEKPGALLRLDKPWDQRPTTLSQRSSDLTSTSLLQLNLGVWASWGNQGWDCN